MGDGREGPSAFRTQLPGGARDREVVGVRAGAQEEEPGSTDTRPAQDGGVRPVATQHRYPALAAPTEARVLWIALDDDDATQPLRSQRERQPSPLVTETHHDDVPTQHPHSSQLDLLAKQSEEDLGGDVADDERGEEAGDVEREGDARFEARLHHEELQ